MHMTFRSVEEAAAGPKWQSLCDLHWPAYRHWFLSEGIEARATYGETVRQLRAHMPELLPTYERLCELAGGGDIAARFLGLYCPPAYLTGCSQVVWPEGPLLIRNYDYNPALCEGLILKSRWNDRTVIAMVDCLWGVLDGVNDAGLAISLTFGGRRVVGEGFGVPLVLRYILEFCDTAKQAGEVLKRIPIHMAYNVTMVDKSGAFLTAFLSPDREPIVRPLPIAANHQGQVDWHNYARFTSTLERERFIFFRLRDQEMTAERMIKCFLREPLHTTAYDHGFGTLYTSVYNPADGTARFIWPDGEVRQSLKSFTEGTRHQSFLPADLMRTSV